MKKIMLMAAALMVATLSVSAQAVQPATYENTIDVTGRSQMEVVPNEIYVRIVIDEPALKQKQTVEKMETDMIAALKKLGINTDKDLKIGNMSSGYQDYFLKKNEARTTATYELKVADVQLLGKVYQRLESLGISNINIVRLSHSNIREFQNQMRVEALKNAQQIAQILAGAVNQKAGRAVQITDYNNDMYVPAPRAEVMYMSKAAGANDSLYDTELEFKNIKLTYSVQAKFALE